MNYQDKSKEELIKELLELQHENSALKLAGEKSLTGNLSGGVPDPRSGNEANLADLRHTAETELKKRKDKVCLVSETEADTLKLLHELDVHQVEIEMQNEELMQAIIQAEKAIENFTNLYDFAPTGYFTLSNTGKIIGLNLVGAKMLGKKRTHATGSMFGFIVSDETKPVFKAFLDRAFKSQVNETCEVVLLADGNQPTYVHLSGIITQNGENCLVAAVDITERKQAEEALRKSEKKLNVANKIANIGNWELNHVSSRLSWSEGIFEMFEIDAGKFEATYEAFLDAIHPADRERVNMAYSESLKNKTSYEITHRLLMPDGRIKWVNEICRTDYDVQGNPVRSFGIVQDVTVRKQTEIQLQINEAQINAILNGISANIAFVDKDLKIIWANKTAAESVHKTPDELVGQTCHRFWADPSKPCENCPSLKAFATKKPEQTIMQTPDGKYWEERGEPIFDTEGNLIGVVEIATDITGRKQAEEEKREANARLRTLSKAIEQSPVTTVITDVAGNIEFVNPKFTEITGYTAEEAYGKNPRILKAGDKQASEYKELWDTILSGKNWHGVFKNKKKNGEIFWESAVISPVKNEEGAITHFLAVKEDITERKQAEEALRKSEECFREVLENSIDASYKRNLQTNIYEYLSPVFAQISGYTAAEMNALPLDVVLGLMHPTDLDEVNRVIAGALSSESRGAIYQMDYRFKHKKDGRYRWIHDQFTVMRDALGKPSAFIGSVSDITERKQTEDALRESEQKLVSILDDVSDVIWSLSLPDMKVNFISPSVEKVFGRTVKEFTENTALWSEIVHPDDKQISDKAFEQVSKKGSAVRECRIIRPDGSIVWISDKSKIIYDKTGTPNRIDGVSRDITERKKAEDALRASEEKYRLLTENAADVIWVLNLSTGKFTYISPSVYQLRGFTAEEAMLETLEDALTPDSIAAVNEAIVKNVQNFIGHPEIPNYYINEVQQYCKNGKVIWVEVSTQFQYGSTGDIEVLGVSRNIDDRKKAEEALRKSEQMLRETGHIAKLGGWEIDLATNKLTWAEETYRIHEVDPLSQPLIDDGINFYAPEAQPIIKEALAHTIKEGVPFDLELPFITAKGKSLWVRSIGNAEQVDGQTIRLFGLFQDITERKEAEIALRESEETYRSILLASPDDITITDLEGRILMVSPATLHILRCKDENELIGHFVDEFIFPDDRERAKNNTTLMFQGIMTGPGTYRGLRADGSIFEMETNAEFIRDASGQPNKILFIVRDISERKKVEKALQASDEKHRVLFENSPDAYLTILNGKYNDCNKAAENLLCGARQQIIGQSPDALSPELQPDGELSEKAAANRMAQAIESGFISFEWVHRRFDGSDFLAEISIGVIQIDGQPALFTVMRDITKRKKIEEALRESEEKFREMANFLPQIIFETDLQGKLTYVNKQAYKIMRYDENDPVIGLSSLEFHIPEERSRAIDNIQQKIVGKTIERSEFMMLRKDGSTFPAKVYSNYYRVNGKPAGLRGLIVDISDIKKAEDLLKETNAYLENLINYANAPIIVWDPQFRITRFNHAFEFITGRTEAEVLGKSLEILFQPELIEKSMSLISKTLTGERWETVEIIIQHRNQTNRTVLWNSATLFAPDGKTPLATIAQGHDITERKATEEALAQSRSELKAIYDFSPVMMCLVDANRRIIFANPAFTALTGTAEELLKGGHACGVFGCINAMDDVRGCGYGNNCRNCSLRMAIEDTFKNGTGHVNVEYHTTLVQNGETRKLSLLGSTALIESNNQRNLLLCLNNITERKHMEDKLEESSTRLLLAARAGGVGIWDWDLINNILEWDDQMFSLYGITKSQFGGAYEAWLAGVHPDSKAQSDAEIQRVLNGEKEFDTEFKVLWPDGSIHDIRAMAIVLRNSSGKPLRMIGTNWDITRQKKTEAEIKQRNEELHELNATKDKFFSIIAHDLKSPFNSIMGFSELLVEQITEKNYDGIKKYAAIILESSQRAMDLLMNLMDWSRSQTGRIEFNPEFFEMVEIINETELLFDEIARQKSIGIKKALPRHAPVFADKAMINTVLRNLISNAIKFTKSGGEILISVIEKPDEITVSVKDSGIGIPAGRIDKLFRIDENYSTPGTNNEKGTGLGLILCKEFVEKHNGQIWAESEVGKGSVFSFTLPKT
jgi:PAS domain S-box-containing protein